MTILTPSFLRWLSQGPGAALTSDHTLLGSKQQKRILSQFWKPEICNQGVPRVADPWRLGGRTQDMPLPASGGQCEACRCSLRSLPPASSGLLSLRLKPASAFLFKDSCHWVQGPPRPQHEHGCRPFVTGTSFSKQGRVHEFQV